MVFAGDPVAELEYLDEILENMKLTYNPNHFLLIDVYKHAIEAAAKCEEVSLTTRLRWGRADMVRVGGCIRCDSKCGSWGWVVAICPVRG